jgi:hypothetical protein
MAFSFWLAWNVTTRRAVIGISSPVLGLRPGRCGFSRSWKLPKPDSFTLRPSSSALADLLEKALYHVLRFALVEAELLEEQVGEFCFGERHRSGLLEVLLPKLGAESIFEDAPQRAHAPIDLGVRSKYVQYPE